VSGKCEGRKLILLKCSGKGVPFNFLFNAPSRQDERVKGKNRVPNTGETVREFLVGSLWEGSANEGEGRM